MLGMEDKGHCKPARQTASAADWFRLFRPWSYTATLVPFLVAAALVAGSGMVDCGAWQRWGLAFLAGLLFQATVNLLNTWGDERSGVDDVPGAIRTTPQVHDGKVSMRTLFVVALICLALAVALGVYLCFYVVLPEPKEWGFCWTLLVAGIVGALGSINYSTGIKFKYHGLGVPFVSFLMGPLEILVAVAVLLPREVDRVFGIVFTSMLDRPFEGLVLPVYFLLLSLPVALLVGVIMHGNDMRDIPSDRAAGIVTLASRLGSRRALGYYRFCHYFPYVVTTAAAVLGCMAFFPGAERCAWLLLPLLALPLSVRTVRMATSVYREDSECPKWRGLERASGLVHLVFGVLYAAAWFAVVGMR